MNFSELGLLTKFQKIKPTEDLYERQLAGICKDVESILNARIFENGYRSEVLKTSYLTFGLKNYLGYTSNSSEVLDGLAKEITDTLEIHESRLADVKVNITKDEDSNKLGVHVYIRAKVKRTGESVEFSGDLRQKFAFAPFKA